MLQWPYLSLFNCFWATSDLLYRYDNMEVPLLWQPSRNDGSGTYANVGFWENVLFNITFNLGYMVRDIWWLFEFNEDEGEDWADYEKRYFYRYGFVCGDLYMRIFFRNI